MLIVVLPAIVLTLAMAWRYHGRKKSTYTPNFKSSKKLEITIWLIPSIIIIILSCLVWKDTFKLNPYKPIIKDATPLTIQVIAFNWKWLFIYPNDNIATINELVLPVNVPIHFRLTSATVMNGFFIPALGSQIMVMPRAETELNLIANHEGTYDGISSNFSGTGFTGMQFITIVKSMEAYHAWIKQVQNTKDIEKLDAKNVELLKTPTLNNPIQYYSEIPKDFFSNIQMEE